MHSIICFKYNHKYIKCNTIYISIQILQIHSDLHKTLEQAQLHSANSVAAASVKKAAAASSVKDVDF